MRRASLRRLPLSASVLALLLASCALNADVTPAAPAAPAAPAVAAPTGPCAAAPAAPAEAFPHRRNRVYRSLGDPRFRGIDLIAMEDDDVQTLGGKIAYTAADKDVSDEEVLIFACFQSGWRRIDSAITDRDGRFE